MAAYITDSRHYSDIASAIRSKNGQTVSYKPSQMAAAIELLSEFNLSKFRTMVDGSITEVSADDLQGLTLIGDNAFHGRYSLKKVGLPDTLTDILSYAFTDCTALEKITIPNSVETIMEYAFKGCTGLTEITIGNGIVLLSVECFNGCSSLTKIICWAATPPSIEDDEVFGGVPANCAIYVPEASVSAYKSAPYWNHRSNYIYSNVISFTLDGTSYRAYINMSWPEWVNSEFNTAGFEHAGSYIIKSDRVVDVEDINTHISPGTDYTTKELNGAFLTLDRESFITADNKIFTVRS